LMKILDGKGKGNIAEFGGCNAFFSVSVKNLGLSFLLVFRLQDILSGSNGGQAKVKTTHCRAADTGRFI
jgi:hypothetical protein